MKKLFINIHTLVQVRESHPSFLSGEEMGLLPVVENAFLEVNEGRITSFGTMIDCPSTTNDAQIIDLKGKWVLPTWCDSHTHLVYAGNREREFVDRIKGLSYQQIAANGGGILNSALKLNACSEDDLYQQSAQRLEEVIRLGTGAIEIKSGYGLSVEGELKMLRVVKRLKQNYSLPIKATFLGAHAVPKNMTKADYLSLLIEYMLPAIASEKLAEYIDIFCEEGYFSLDDTERILLAGKEYGLIPKIHVNQFTAMGGVKMAVKHQALSVDHLEELVDDDVEALKGSSTMPVALPGCSYFLSIPYTPARKIIDAGLPLALATDYNPGSAPSGNMNQVVSAACIKMKMTPEEAINAATLNGAYAMGLASEVGSFTIGKRANFMVLDHIPSYAYIPYAFGSSFIEQVYLDGNLQ